jgi:predicted TIM-barrel fold metal-dependent hydrolase
MIIDWQHHYCPPEILTRRGKKKMEPDTPIYNDQGQVASHFKPELYEIDTHLKFMDAAGIDKAVLSMAGNITFEESKIINDAFAKIMEAHPDRFIGLASSFPGKGDASLGELNRAIKELGLKGVSIDYQIEGQTLDSKTLWPYYERVSELKVPLFVHIAGTRQGFEGLMSKDFNLWTTLGTMVVDQSATVRIILSGILAQFPDLQIVVAHLGGGIAAIKERFTRYLKVWGKGIWTELGGTPPFPEPLDKQFEDHFNRLYFDMAGYEGGMNAVKCALVAIDPRKLLFGTDYPFNFTDISSGVKEYIRNIRSLDLPQEVVEGMLGGNAAGLLGI